MTATPELSRLDRIEQLILLTTTALGETARQQQQVNTNGDRCLESHNGMLIDS